MTTLGTVRFDAAALRLAAANSREFGRLMLRHLSGRPRPVLIFTMGKVASTSLERSIQSQTGLPTYCAHSLNPKEFERRLKVVEAEFAVGSSHERIRRRFPVLFRNRALGRCVRASRALGLRWRIISLVREPIGQQISAFFQSVERRYDDFQALSAHDPEGRIAADAADFVRRNIESDWFDQQMKPVFGIDVYAHPFLQEQGWTKITGDAADLMVVKYEMLSQAEGAIGEFLGEENFQIGTANKSAEKSYAEQYRRATETIRFDPETLDAIYGRKRVTHFYTKDEIARFRAQWGLR